MRNDKEMGYPMGYDVGMNRNITSTVILVVFFCTWFNSAIIYTSFNKAPDGHSKAVMRVRITIGDEITLSSIHTCTIDVIGRRNGLAIGFPRFTGNCWLDKSAEKVSG